MHWRILVFFILLGILGHYQSKKMWFEAKHRLHSEYYPTNIFGTCDVLKSYKWWLLTPLEANNAAVKNHGAPAPITMGWRCKSISSQVKWLWMINKKHKLFRVTISKNVTMSTDSETPILWWWPTQMSCSCKNLKLFSTSNQSHLIYLLI